MNVFIKKKINQFIILFKGKFWLVYFLLGFFVFRWFQADSFILAGDLSWPQFFSNFFRYTRYVWDDSINLGYLASRQIASLYPYATWGMLLEMLNLPGFVIQLIIYYISFVISGLGMYLFSQKVGLKQQGAFIAGLIYMFSPYAALVTWNPSYGITFPFYCYLPLSLYFFINILNINRASFFVLNMLGIALLFLGASYSNPAFFLLFVSFTFLIFIYFLIIGKNRLLMLKKYALFILIFILFNAFWLVPFLGNIGSEFALATNEIAGLSSDLDNVKLNSVRIMDAFRMTGLWTLQAEIDNNYYYDWHEEADSTIYILFSFFLVVLALFSLFNKGSNSNVTLLMLFILIVGVFLNSGANVGGFLHQIHLFIFSSSYLVRMFRATYLKFGIFLVLPITFLVGVFFDSMSLHIQKYAKRLYAVVIIILFSTFFLLIMGRPFINGEIIKSGGDVLASYNVQIPKEYYSLRQYDEKLKLDSRYISFPIPSSYNLSLEWDNGGFNGADFLRFFLSRSIVNANNGSYIIRNIIAEINETQINLNKLFGLSSIRHIFQHKDINERNMHTFLTQQKFRGNENFNNEFLTQYFEIYSINNFQYLPHFYVPQNILITSVPPANMAEVVSSSDYQINSAIFFKNQNKGSERQLSLLPQRLNHSPVIEFKKINSIKYRLKIHGASNAFPLVFSENFHKGWKVYPVKSSQAEISSSAELFNGLGDYKILDGNKEDQADKEELSGFIEAGWISTLGNLKEKEIMHEKYESGKGELDYVEKYKIDFISKNFQGTIQNDNLPNGYFGETWFNNSLGENSHLTANSYANSWVISPAEICSRNNGMCVKNPDGSYDFEMIVEFWPQRLFYISLFISIATLAGCLVCLGWCLFREKNKLE